MSEILNILHNDGPPTVDYYCSICDTITEGFSLCLKCNLQTYEVIGMPDIIKAAQSVGSQENVYEKEIWNKAIEQCLITNAKFNGSTDVDAAIRKLKK